MAAEGRIRPCQMTNGIETSAGDAATRRNSRTPCTVARQLRSRPHQPASQLTWRRCRKETGQAVCVPAISHRSSSRAA
jgi:hypothetical protein